MKGFLSATLARLTQNIGYKLLALILAFWWWTYAQSQQYPRETRTVSVKAQVVRSGPYVLLNGEPTVRVRINGFRDDLNAFDTSSLKASLDLSRATPGQQQTLPVMITGRVCCCPGVARLRSSEAFRLLVSKAFKSSRNPLMRTRTVGSPLSST